MTLRIYCIRICMSDCQFYKIPKVSRISIVSRTPFFASEFSCKKVRLIIREIRYLVCNCISDCQFYKTTRLQVSPHCFLPCVQDITDKVDYLVSLGKAQTAAIKRDAAIGVAEAEKDAGIKVRMQFFNTGFAARCKGFINTLDVFTPYARSPFSPVLPELRR